jgi:hypothetical protein
MKPGTAERRELWQQRISEQEAAGQTIRSSAVTSVLARSGPRLLSKTDPGSASSSRIEGSGWQSLSIDQREGDEVTGIESHRECSGSASTKQEVLRQMTARFGYG